MARHRTDTSRKAGVELGVGKRGTKSGDAASKASVGVGGRKSGSGTGTLGKTDPEAKARREAGRDRDTAAFRRATEGNAVGPRLDREKGPELFTAEDREKKDGAKRRTSLGQNTALGGGGGGSGGGGARSELRKGARGKETPGRGQRGGGKV